MVVIDKAHEPLCQNMGVNLGGGDVCMAEKLLDSSQIRTVLKQMAGESMAKHVRRYFFG